MVPTFSRKNLKIGTKSLEKNVNVPYQKLMLKSYKKSDLFFYPEYIEMCSIFTQIDYHKKIWHLTLTRKKFQSFTNYAQFFDQKIILIVHFIGANAPIREMSTEKTNSDLQISYGRLHMLLKRAAPTQMRSYYLSFFLM